VSRSTFAIPLEAEQLGEPFEKNFLEGLGLALGRSRRFIEI
jgi:hypothetical protein